MDTPTLLEQLQEAITAATTTEEALSQLAYYTPKILGTQRASIARPAPDGVTFEVFISKGKGALLLSGSKMLLFGTAVGTAIEEGRVVSTATEASDAYGDWRHLAASGLTQFIITPIFEGDDVIATLNVGGMEPRTFDEADIALAAQITDHFKRFTSTP